MSNIDYAILASGSANKTKLKAIEKTMNTAIRLMGFKKNFFDYYSLLNLEHMIKINKGKLCGSWSTKNSLNVFK